VENKGSKEVNSLPTRTSLLRGNSYREKKRALSKRTNQTPPTSLKVTSQASSKA